MYRFIQFKPGAAMHISRLIVTAILLTAMLSGCKPSTQPEKINLCQGGIITPLTLLAQEKGYYAKEGLELAFHPLGDGKLAMEAFLSGKCDAAIVAEPPIVSRAFTGNPDFSIIATVSSSDNATRIVADRRRGIASVGDLKGKRIGVRKGNITHFFLDMYLKANAIRSDQVTFIYLEPAQLSEALTAGKIDAYVASDIYLTEGTRRLGEHAIVLSEPGLCFNSSCLIVRNSMLKEKPDTARKMLRALLRAEARASRNPEEVTQFVAKRRELSEQSASAIIKQQRLAVTLPQHLLLTLDDHATWMQEQGMVPTGKRPEFLKLINETALKELSPGSVSIQR